MPPVAVLSPRTAGGRAGVEGSVGGAGGGSVCSSDPGDAVGAGTTSLSDTLESPGGGVSGGGLAAVGPPLAWGGGGACFD